MSGCILAAVMGRNPTRETFLACETATIYGETMIKIKTGKYTFRFDMSPLEHLLFLTVGRAMTQIQNFESVVATIVCSLNAHENEEIEDEETALAYYDNILDEFNNKTLGRLIVLIKQKVEGHELHDKLMNVRDGRNFIAHHALRQYPGLDEEQTVGLTQKIEDIIEEIQDVQNLLIAELSAQNVTHISSVYVDLDTGEIMDAEEN
jgi:hypothetical protein